MNRELDIWFTNLFNLKFRAGFKNGTAAIVLYLR